jgi:catechol 2,3-dioxygenase-like lactoylglutathione lyase family enzyme
MRLLRGLSLFVAGLLAGIAIQTVVAQTQNRGIIGLNHVALSVPNIDEAVAYYTKTMGFPEAFRSTDEQGQINLVYVQISKNTFVELQPANPQRPPGINHLGLHVENMAAATAIFKRRHCFRDARQRDESDPVEHHRPEWNPNRAFGTTTGITAPSGHGAMEIDPGLRLFVLQLG